MISISKYCLKKLKHFGGISNVEYVLDQLLKFKHFQFLHPLKYEANLSNVQKYMKIIRKFKRKLLAISLG